MPVLLPRLPKRSESRRKFSGDPEEFRLTLIEHLEELRDRIMRSLAIVSGTWVIGWFEFAPIYGYLNNTATKAVVSRLPKGVNYIPAFTHSTDAFFLKFKLSFLIALVIAFPFLVMQLWGFVAPGLKPSEQKPFRALAPFSLLLFIVGAGFAWWVLPNALIWFTSYLEEFPGTSLMQEPGALVFFTLKMLIAFGVAFQLPLIVYGLGMADLLSADTLLKYWRQSATVIFVVTAIVTPSQDIFTMLAMAIPLCLLFVISVYCVKFSQGVRARRRKRAEKAAEVPFE